MALHPPPVVLRTARLELVPLDVEAARELVEVGVTPARRHVAGYPTEATLVAAGLMVTAAVERRDLGPFTTYQVVRQLDGSVVGDCGFHGPPDDGGVVEIGCGIAPPARGRGYATEVVASLIGLALLQHGVRRVQASTTRSDVPARRVLAKAGMRVVAQDGELLVHEA